MPVINSREESIRAAMKSYYANIILIDKKIGVVLDNLKTSREWNNTVIFFSSNHGDYMESFGMMKNSNYLSEALIRVPFLMKPAIEDYVDRDEEPVGCNFDIAATSLEIAGIEIPLDMSDCSLLSYIEDLKIEDLKDCQKIPIYLETANLRSMTRGVWKLIYYKNRDYGEHYDLTDDP